MDDQVKSGNLNQVLNKISELAKNGQQGQAYSQYVDKLIEEKGFPDITPEIREEIKKDVLRRLDDFIAARIIAGLSDEDVNTFEQMLKDAKPEPEIQKFVTEHITDFVEFLTNVLVEFRGVYLGTIQSPQFVNVDGDSKPEPKTHTNPPPAPVMLDNLSKIN